MLHPAFREFLGEYRAMERRAPRFDAMDYPERQAVKCGINRLERRKAVAAG